MQIVINIPEDVVVNDSYANYFECLSGKLYETLHNGTPLPKGHGRLIDADALLDQISRDKREAFTKHQVWLLLSQYNDNASTVIEADKEM